MGNINRLRVLFSQLLVAAVLLALVSASCAPGALPTPTSAPPPTAAAAPPPKPMALTPAATPVPARAATPTIEPTRPTPTPPPAADTARYGGVLTLGHISDPQSPDAHQEASMYMLRVVGPTTNMLIQNDPLDQTKIIGDLAKSWDISPDGLTYTFHLQEGAKFHDGAPVTAEDARYSLERIRNPPKGVVSPRQVMFRNVASMEAVDKNTLKITLKRPQAAFLAIIAIPFHVVYQKKVIEEQGKISWSSLVGSGPYKLKDYTRGVSVEHVKNPDYFIKGRPYLDGLVFYIIPDTAAFVAAVRTGKLLLSPTTTSGITPASDDILKKELPQLKVLRLPTNTVGTITFNTKRKPWDDVRVRKAVDLVLDREAAIRVITQGAGEVGSYLMPGMPWAMPREELLKRPGYRQPKDQDVAEAKRLMAEAGYGGKTIETTFPIRAGQRLYENIAIFTKAEMAKVGIEASIRAYDSGTMSKIVFAHDFDTLPYSEGFASEDPDVVFGDFYVAGALRNYGEWSDPKVEKLYGEQSQTMDPLKRRQLVQEMERAAMDGVPRVTLYWAAQATYMWPQVRNYVLAKSLYINSKLQDVWLAAQ